MKPSKRLQEIIFCCFSVWLLVVSFCLLAYFLATNNRINSDLEKINKIWYEKHAIKGGGLE